MGVPGSYVDRNKRHFCRAIRTALLGNRLRKLPLRRKRGTEQKDADGVL